MIFALGMALASGLALATQAVVNSAMSAQTGPLRGALVSVTISLITLILVLTIFRPAGVLARAVDAPPFAWIGGILGVVVLVGIMVATPKLGVLTTISTVVCGQMLASLLIDQFGWLGTVQRTITAPRLLGAALLILGVNLVLRK